MSPSHPPFGDYATVHTNSSGPGDTRPTAMQIVEDEGLLSLPGRLSDKTVLITGGTSGLGLEVAKALYVTGARVFITGRCDPIKGREIAASIHETCLAIIPTKSSSSGEGRNTHHPVQFVSMDLSDLASVRDGTAQFLAQSNNGLNLLICNAGVMAPQTRTTTVQGHEMQFGVNHLAHFYLFKLLQPTLLKCSTKNSASRVVTVASCAHRASGLIGDGDYDFQKTKYVPGVAYGQSKTANIYMANEVERRYGAQGLHAVSVHPGVILETGLVRHMTDDSKALEAQFNEAMPNFAHEAKNAKQGSASIVWAAVAAKLGGKGGLYLEDCDISQPVREDLREDEWYEPGRSIWCYDEVAEEKLWSDSEEMLASWL